VTYLRFVAIMSRISPIIIPDWPAPDNIRAFSTTRESGFSQDPFDSLNLGDHVGDDVTRVAQNREKLIYTIQAPESPRWLKQVHGHHIVDSCDWKLNIEADAIFSQQNNHVCTIMTADCLPILLCNQHGDAVAAIHAGWRSLALGIIEKTVRKFHCEPDTIFAWLGPAIGSSQFEVGQDVYDAFCRHSPQANNAFKATNNSHYLADIYQLARQKLAAQGVSSIYGGDFCTFSDEQQFFSYRRDGKTGRMATLIWIE